MRLQKETALDFTGEAMTVLVTPELPPTSPKERLPQLVAKKLLEDSIPRYGLPSLWDLTLDWPSSLR